MMVNDIDKLRAMAEMADRARAPWMVGDPLGVYASVRRRNETTMRPREWLRDYGRWIKRDPGWFVVACSVGLTFGFWLAT